jgi:ribosomal protein L39E
MAMAENLRNPRYIFWRRDDMERSFKNEKNRAIPTAIITTTHEKGE